MKFAKIDSDKRLANFARGRVEDRVEPRFFSVASRYIERWRGWLYMKFPDGPTKRGRSELVLKSLAQLLGGLGHVLTLPMQVYLRSRRVLHRRVGPSHGIAVAELGPRDSHALYVTQPGLHDLPLLPSEKQAKQFTRVCNTAQLLTRFGESTREYSRRVFAEVESE